MAGHGTQTYVVVIEHGCESWGAHRLTCPASAWCPARSTAPSS
ncbi:MAG TPA: hypothetical protein VG165_16810 [Solirubrobacteraceae bacterium]|nr:hypothetical protein [Solirubrobacteraceae bacterium]